MHTEVEFTPDAECPRWLKFLEEIFDSDQETIAYAQRCVGYFLTGSVREQCIFNFFSLGRNGKSTFLETVRHVMGPYAKALPFTAFEQKARASIPHDLAASAGVRLVTAVETNESVRLNESRIKAMTGSDKLSARRLYENLFEFTPTAKIVLCYNYKPIITDNSPAMWRQQRVIVFNRRFDGTPEEDKGLLDKLKAEAPGILAWSIRGALEWQRSGLGMPPAVLEATQQYREESDQIGRFLADWLHC